MPIREIALVGGGKVLVDEQDFELVSSYRWYEYKGKRASYATARIGGKMVRMHRLIMNCPAEKAVDHRDFNGLNNTRENLRLATKQQNTQYRRKTKNKKHSKYKGVTFNNGLWVASIGRPNGKILRIGNYDKEDDAARGYNKWASYLFGEFALLNNV